MARSDSWRLLKLPRNVNPHYDGLGTAPLTTRG
jgi:hypothetical protein